MQYIGIDIIEIGRIQSAIEEWGERFLRRIYTTSELERYYGNIPSLAARFAAKEAVMKALNIQDRSIKFTDIEVLPESGGRPSVRLYNTAAARARHMNIRSFSISLSHSRENAVAVVTGESEYDIGTRP
jgi:holo-[acyl-carrier protein] synthase